MRKTSRQTPTCGTTAGTNLIARVPSSIQIRDMLWMTDSYVADVRILEKGSIQPLSLRALDSSEVVLTVAVQSCAVCAALWRTS